MSTFGQGRWTKKDLRFLQGQIDSAWLTGRPLSGDVEAWNAHFRSVLERSPHVRIDLVLSGVRAAIATSRERYSKTCECIGNAIARRIYRDQTDEFVERFAKDAREEDEATKKLDAIRERLLAEGLPPEVATYVPEGARAKG